MRRLRRLRKNETGRVNRASLLFLLISCAVNIALNFAFVAGLEMNVAGAALATICSMYISWLFSIVYIKKKYPELEFKMLPRGVNRHILGDIIKIGLPLGLNNSIYSIGHILMQSLINAQGSIFMAGCSVAGKVTGIANVAITSFSSAGTTFAGQNLGAENYTRLYQGARRIPFFSGLITCIAGLTLTACCRPILMLFNKEADVLSVASQYVHIVLPFTWTFAVFNGIISYSNGLGEVRYPTVINILMLWAVRIPTAHFINRYIDGRYIMASLPISFAFGMFCMFFFFLTPRWRAVKEKAAAQ